MTAPKLASDAIDGLERDADRAASLGDVATALATLERIVAQAPGRIDTWLKLAAIRRALGDLTGALAAISSALRTDPLHLLALLSRARILEASGRSGDAGREYTRALAQIPDESALPAALQPLVAHARRASEAHLDAIAATWDSAITHVPDLSDCTRRRLDRFTSNALRRTRVFHSEPTHYHYPGLSEREFHCRDLFPWLAALEAATPVIRSEFEALSRAGIGRAEPYIRYGDDVPVRQWSALNQSLDWTAFHLLHGGQVVRENASRCPQTMAFLGPIDQPRIAGRSPNAMFSLLRPRTHIPPHTGIANTRLVCHLPLIVPAGCSFRVGAERREWRVGEAFVFDDTIEHEATNDSDDERVVLIVDLWHPGLDTSERAAITRIMEADEAEHGAPL